ncbi:MAG: chloride channel protein [Deltaproteobacteria bacterium]|nr:chloride channel protein [Deltaproteobacteria bacterium]
MISSFQNEQPDRQMKFQRTSAKEALVLMGLAIGVGMVSALSAVALNLLVHGSIPILRQWQGQWWMIFIPAIGAASAAWYVRGWLKDDLGHGVPELIRAATFGGGALRRDMIWSRLVGSFLTVASGGSSGLEGPIATSGAAIGSTTASVMGLHERRRVLLLGYGVAGAIAAIFNAPLTGMVFALEVILREWSAFSILPTIVAAVSATQFSRMIMGNQIAFPHEVFAFGTLDLMACVLLGAATGLLSVLLARSLTFWEGVFGKMPFKPWVTAGVGGLLVGVLGLYMPLVLHDGYEAIQGFLGTATEMSLWLVALFILLKFLSVNFTLASGGVGGVFAPSLVLGSALGYGYGRLLKIALPGMGWASHSAYALVGMAGMVAGVMHAPLTGMFLVLEITGGYRLILPLMITAVLAMLTSYFFEAGSVYTRGLIKRGTMASRGSDLHLLHTMVPRELLDKENVVLHEGMLLGEFVEVFKEAKRNVFPVVEKSSHRWLGVVYLDDIRPYLFDQSLYGLMTMGEIMHMDLPMIDASEPVPTAVQKFEASGAWSLPVVEEGKFLGMMSKSTLFDRYRRELIVHTE